MYAHAMTGQPVLDIAPFSAASSPRNHEELLRVARALRSGGHRALGLFPAGPHAAVPPIALQLARAMVEASGESVALVDANVRLPAFPPPPQSEPPEPFSPDQDDRASLFAERELEPSLYLLSPRSIARSGAGVPQLALLVERYRDRYAHLVADLTGFDQIGDHLSAAALVDGVIVVARSGASKETELLRIRADLPQAKTLGVLLTG